MAEGPPEYRPNIAVSEVDPAGNEIFRLSMTRDGARYGTGRVSRETEADLAVPLNLPDSD